ncbi:RNA polymerase II holoenzyme cyclin-like subunit [Psilocybe cubensis]|uniref:RNA polymerase II holoenzyme cyclin-like subunit n=2 Tax=Psilocybe cubensis TaxID=181762 RepID=A0ACB8H6I9_PSICU|nr:RNA polymerase II holoenzyme cyclin-like subunit [Psilocybe cubensis]KAH9483252.1 RNA polymerase II holoenzyme cyclin-like subunit [Psilocybe cubensis]
MATDFWASSHYKRWLVDRATLNQARLEDLHYVEDPEHLDYLAIYFANVITKLGKKLQFRQRTIATAIVFFRRFYLKNSYCETDPFTVIAACCYLAAKAEESPVHIKVIVTESRSLFSQDIYASKSFILDNGKVAEMEFYLVDDLECDLVVFHPYRTLLSLCKKEPNGEMSSEEGEADDAGVGIGFDDGPRYWGTGEGQLGLTPVAFQTAWSIINDTYRSQLCLLYPPHLIAIAAIYLTFILHPPTRHAIKHENSTGPSRIPELPAPRRSSRQAHHTMAQPASPKKPQDPITFLSELNVSLPLVATIAQEIISLYTLWDQYKDDGSPDATKAARELTNSPSPLKRSGSAHASVSGVGTPGTDEVPDPEGNYITTAFLSGVVQRIREFRLMDVTPMGRPVAVNKRLERTQAVG